MSAGLAGAAANLAPSRATGCDWWFPPGFPGGSAPRTCARCLLSGATRKAEKSAQKKRHRSRQEPMPRRKKPRLRRVPRAVAPAAEEAPTEAMELPLPAGPAASQGDDPIVGAPVAMEHVMEPPAAAVDEVIVGPPVAAGAGEFPTAAEADGPPPVPEVPPVPGPPPVPPPLFVVPGPRLPRGEPWAGGRFALARNPRSSGSSAITVTCMLQRHGDRCNRTPSERSRVLSASERMVFEGPGHSRWPKCS